MTNAIVVRLRSLAKNALKCSNMDYVRLYIQFSLFYAITIRACFHLGSIKHIVFNSANLLKHIRFHNHTCYNRFLIFASEYHCIYFHQKLI